MPLMLKYIGGINKIFQDKTSSDEDKKKVFENNEFNQQYNYNINYSKGDLRNGKIKGWSTGWKTKENVKRLKKIFTEGFRNQ